MNVLVGYAGQASLGHAAFLGVGGVRVRLRAQRTRDAVRRRRRRGRNRRRWSAALVLGGVALRVSGLYLALVTIAFGLFAQETLFNIRFAHRRRRRAGRAAAVAVLRRRRLHVPLHRRALPGADLRLAPPREPTRSRHSGVARRRARGGVVGHRRHRPQADGVRDLRRHRRHRRRAVRLDRTDRLEGRLRAQPVDHVPADDGGGRGRAIAGASCRAGSSSRCCRRILDRAHANFHVFPFTELTATWEPAIGAILLLLTLTLFPGGIAQQQGASVQLAGRRTVQARPGCPRSSAGRRHGCPTVT